MARAHCTVFSLLLPSNNSITKRTYPLLVAYSIPASNPSIVRLRRKNHLRHKILKTLTTSHPSITSLPPQESPLLPSHTTEVDDSRVEFPADGVPPGSVAAAAGEGGEWEELPVSGMAGTSGEFNGIAGKLSAKSILKYGAILFGAFVLQTIFSVLIMLDDDSKQKAEDSNVRGKRSVLFDGSGKTMRVTSGSGVFSLKDRLEMDKKIEEIKLMAREARRIEGDKEGQEIGDPESDDESAVSGHRLGIEREIGERLLKLQDRVNSDQDKTTLLNVVKNLGTSINSTAGVVKDNKNVNEGNGSLMFKKKFKYKSPSTKPRKAPKGFSGTRDHKASNAETRRSSSKDKAEAQENRSTASDHVQIFHEDKRLNQQDVEARETDSRLSLEDQGKLVDEEANTLQNTGKNLEELMAKSNEETGTRVKDKRSDGGFGEDAKTNFEKGDDVLSINGNPKHGIADNVSAAKNVKVKQANAETDIWWLKLRYVLVIIMRRGSDKEGPSGLYNLKMTSQEDDQNDYSYIVAFEDHADANNFCYLLESFFEDLGDFSADAVPMSIKELHQAVKSHGKKVVVVKKRQLQLYAGQLLSDVENTLCSLAEQSQNVRPADSK
ncbi:hypothetical protein K1719_005827 [Acacia pycnantha]|nr:hypothetical protein K1719_005827 [Acacia pycnantha]